MPRTGDAVWSFQRIGATLALGLLLPLALLVAACGDDDNGGTTDSGDASPAAQTPLVQLPADYPEDFPAYPNTTLSDSYRYADQAIVVFQTGDSLESVGDFYRDALAKPPWEVLAESGGPTENLLLINFAHLDQPIQGSATIVTIGGATPYAAVTLRFTVPVSVGPGSPTSAPLPADEPTATGGS